MVAESTVEGRVDILVWKAFASIKEANFLVGAAPLGVEIGLRPLANMLDFANTLPLVAGVAERAVGYVPHSNTVVGALMDVRLHLSEHVVLLAPSAFELARVLYRADHVQQDRRDGHVLALL